MKRINFFIAILAIVSNVVAENTISEDSIKPYTLDEVAVTSLYRNNITTGSELSADYLKTENHGQGVDYVFSKLPSIYAYNDNGTHMGYTYFRMRGMGQERINVTLDGMPWNEAEDFGCYFSNSPDLMSSMHSIKVERGASVTNNGTSAYAGNISLESTDLAKDTTSYIDVGGGSFSSIRTTAVYNMGIKHKCGFHIKASQESTDGYKENANHDAKAITSKIGYFFNVNHSIDVLTMNGYHCNGQGYMGIAEEYIPQHPTPFKQIKSGNHPSETDNFFTSFNRLQYKGKLNDKTFLTSSLYWQHQNGDYRVGWEDETSPTKRKLNNYNLTYNLYGLNTIVKYYPTNDISIVGGINSYIFQRSHRGYDIANTDTVIQKWHNNGIEPYYDNMGRKPDINLFTTIRWTPINKLNVNGNIQYRHTSLDYNVAKPYLFDSENDIDFYHQWNFINYGLNVEYNINKYSKLYSRYTTTNREPSRVDMFCAEYRSTESEMNTDNETVHDVEIGYELVNKYINANINGFYMKFNDELVANGQLSPTNFLPLHEQHDGYRYGLEISADIHPINNLHVITNCSFIKHNIDFNDKNYNYTFSPNYIFFGEINYLFINKIKVGVNTQFRSKAYIDIYNQFQLPKLFTLGTYINAKINKTIELSLICENITNRLNISNGSTDGIQAYYLIDSPFNLFTNCRINF